MENQPLGDRIVRNFEFLRQLILTKSEHRRRQLLTKATSDQLLAIVEICSNILSRDFVLNKRQHSKLLPHSYLLKSLSRTRTEQGARKKLVQQGTGAFLPALLIPVLVEAARYFLNES